jgi:hypothetical protein
MHVQCRRIVEACPESPIAVIGISAGSGQAVRYVGEQATPAPHPGLGVPSQPGAGGGGERGPVACCVAISPGYDIEECMKRPSWMWCETTGFVLFCPF